MEVPTEAEQLRRRVEDVVTKAGRLGLKPAHRTFRDQAALVELDALDAKLRLLDGSRATTSATLFTIDRALVRLERRCATLAAWLDANGLEAEFTGGADEEGPRWRAAGM